MTNNFLNTSYFLSVPLTSRVFIESLFVLLALIIYNIKNNVITVLIKKRRNKRETKN